MKIILRFVLLGSVFLCLVDSRTFGQEQTNVPVLSPPYKPASAPSNATAAGNANPDPVKSATNKRRWDTKFWAMWLPAIAVQVGDAALTQQCLTHPDCREGNPLLGKRPSPWLLYGVKVGAVGISYLYSRAARKGRDKSWLAYPIALTAFGTAGVVNNAIVLSTLGTQPHQDQALAVGKQSAVGCAACNWFSHAVPSSLTQHKLKYELRASKTN